MFEVINTCAMCTVSVMYKIYLVLSNGCMIEGDFSLNTFFPPNFYCGLYFRYYPLSYACMILLIIIFHLCSEKNRHDITEILSGIKHHNPDPHRGGKKA